MHRLKQEPTSVDRVEVSVGSAGATDWESIDELIQAEGVGPNSTLHRNFRELRRVTGADAVDNDDESHYDEDSTVRFARMVTALGYDHFTFAPYTAVSYWQGVKRELDALVDRVYLQDYAGGEGNDPGEWAEDLGMPVDPGLWSENGPDCADGRSPDEVREQMAEWHASAGISGGFMWLYDDIKKCAAQGGPTAAEYAEAINEATGS
jgi:hypothetical protein